MGHRLSETSHDRRREGMAHRQSGEATPSLLIGYAIILAVIWMDPELEKPGGFVQLDEAISGWQGLLDSRRRVELHRWDDVEVSPC